MNANCTNTLGSYNCTCKKGYEGDGRNCSGKVLSNYLGYNRDWPVSRVKFSCTPTLLSCFVWKSICYVHLVPDIDECSSENNCHVNANCTNTLGSYNCTCKTGYGGDGRNCSGKVRSNDWGYNRDVFWLVLAHLDLVVVACCIAWNKRLRVVYTLFEGILVDFFLIHSISVIFFASVAWLMSSSIPHSKLLLTALTPIKASKQIVALQVSTMVFKNTPHQSAASVPGHQNFELNLDKCEL